MHTGPPPRGALSLHSTWDADWDHIVSAEEHAKDSEFGGSRMEENIAEVKSWFWGQLEASDAD